MPYQITASTYYSTDEERQYLAVGLIDGAIIVIDLALGLEKFFIEKHPAAVTSIAFYEEKVLISGSIDGKVNLCDLESEDQKRVYNCQNVQDTRIPIASVTVGDFGVGIAIDIEGNCRFYDLIRLKKLTKISAKTTTGANLPGGNWRLLPAPIVCTTSEAFLGVVQNEEPEPIKLPDLPLAPPIDPKNPQPPVIIKPYVLKSQKDALKKGFYSGDREKLKSLGQIIQ